MDLRKKIVLIGVVQLVVMAGVLLAVYYRDAKDKARQQFVEKARSVVLTTEATREEMGKKWDSGIFTAEQLGEWAKAGEIDKILATIPVVTAWKAAMAKAEEGGYEFRVPKFQPRNPKNAPDELEARVLKKLKLEGLSEYQEIDESINAVRYFRPIRLTEECMLCHGDPARSAQLWGNDRGMDPTGTRMENWKAGEIHGAFEVVQKLDEADAQIAGAIQKAIMLIGGLVLVGAITFFFLANRGINGLYRPIRAIADELDDGAHQVEDASNQVSSSSQQLAEGTSEQASSLEQTSAALEQMAAMTQTNAENAKQADDLAVKAREAAGQGDIVVGRLQEAMQGISGASEQIGKIIKVIEEIAFQTNLLALNAAVEAARAGDHGKGFAVVADEVRNLAQRAAGAASEITELIRNSNQRSQDGVKIAGEVGVALKGILGDVNSVSELINGITQASKEQAQGVDQVNTAVSEMDKVTQQNAAGAEESASAAEELAAQAASVNSSTGNLRALVGGKGDQNAARGSSRGGPRPRRRSRGVVNVAHPQNNSRPAHVVSGGPGPRGSGSQRNGEPPDGFVSLGDDNLNGF